MVLYLRSEALLEAKQTVNSTGSFGFRRRLRSMSGQTRERFRLSVAAEAYSRCLWKSMEVRLTKSLTPFSRPSYSAEKVGVVRIHTSGPIEHGGL